MVVTGCAARGFETTAGRLSAVVTERGTIDCDAAVLAGGAWSRLFCGNMGIDFPQLKILGSVMRTEKLDGPPELAVAGPDFAFRKRKDGGYTVARRNKYEAFVVPDSFRLLPQFLGAAIRTRKEYRLRLVGRFREEARIPRRWSWTKPARSRRPGCSIPRPIRRSSRKAGGTWCVPSRPSRRRGSRNPGAA